jgi:hypothetical protein
MSAVRPPYCNDAGEYESGFGRMSAARPPRSIRVGTIQPCMRERSPAILPAGLRPSGHDRLRGRRSRWRAFERGREPPPPRPLPRSAGEGGLRRCSGVKRACRAGGSPAVRAGGLRFFVAATSVARNPRAFEPLCSSASDRGPSRRPYIRASARTSSATSSSGAASLMTTARFPRRSMPYTADECTIPACRACPSSRRT